MSEFLDIMGSVLGKNRPGRHGAQRMIGPVVGIVTNNVDPEDRYRVKVSFPWLNDDLESFWARIATPLAGKGEMGAFFLPEVDDEVLVQFFHGDVENCVITGFLYNGTDKSARTFDMSPQDVTVDVPNNTQGGPNDYRGIRSRMLHQLIFNDKEGEGGISLRSQAKHELYFDDKGGAEKIQLYDMDRKQWLEIDVPAKKITMQTDTGEILIKALTKITMQCEDFLLEASNTIKVESGASAEYKYGTSWKVEAGSTADLTSSSAMTIKGSTIDLNP